jgi:hypothetical protein
VWELVRPGIEQLRDGFVTAIETIAAIIEKPKEALNTIIALISGLWGSVKAGVEAFANGIISALKPVIDFISGIANAVNDVANALTGVQTTVSAGGTVGANPMSPRAEGGPVMGGTPYLVGEQGREVFVPSTSGTIIPNGETEGMMGGMTISIGAIYANDAAGGRAAGDAFGQALKEKMASR